VEEQRNVSSLKGEDRPSRGRQQTELRLSAFLDRLVQTSRYAVVGGGELVASKSNEVKLDGAEKKDF
jgi:hypothetical protein